MDYIGIGGCAPQQNLRRNLRPAANDIRLGAGAKLTFTPMRSIVSIVPPVLCAAIFGSACRQLYLPVPPQKVAPKHAVEMLLNMTGGRPADTWGAIVSGVHRDYAPFTDWRWTGEQAEFTLQPPEPAGWSLAVRLTAAKSVIEKVGAQRVAFEVNGKPAGTATLDVSRRYDLKFPLDADVLKSASRVDIRMTVTPCAPNVYGEPYCVLLHSIGLVREPS